jgi:hypothetical protein
MATFLYHYLEHAEHREHIDQAIRDAAVILAQHSAEKASKKLAGKWTGKMTTALLTATKTANEAYREPRHAIYIETSAKHVIELARKEAAAKNANKKIK